MDQAVEQVKFHFDPGCPWCYQTSRWAKRLEQLGVIDLDWGVFSLQVVNRPEGTDARSVDPETVRSGPALRTAILIRDTVGSKRIGPFYTELGKRVWETVPPVDPLVAVREALGAIGLDAALCDEALANPATWDAVLDEHEALIERTQAFGVPTMVLDGGTGPAIFGPVVSVLPDDETAVELWAHVSWLVRYDNFSELKRNRARGADVPVAIWRREQRELEAARQRDDAAAAPA